jgi:RHS repeat-associated protein
MTRRIVRAGTGARIARTCGGWLLGALFSAAQAQVPADPYNYSRTSSYTYDSKGRVLTETTEPDSPAWCVISTHSYDSWGNRVTSTQANCAGAVPTRQQFAARTNSASYAATYGLFPTSATNALGQTGSAAFDARFGAKTSATDIAGLTTTWQLDDFGRPTRETRADGTASVMHYCYLPGRVSDITSNSAGCATSVPAEAPADAVSYVHSEPRDTNNAKMGPFVRVYKDRLGRELRSVTESFDGANQPGGYSGALIVTDTVYSTLGTKIVQTQPYFLSSGSSTTLGSNDAGATLNEYDALGRVVASYSVDPQGLAGTKTFAHLGSKTAAKTLFTFNGQVTTITNDKGQTRTEEKNAIGLVVRITDPAGGQLAHQHDAFGNLVGTKDALQNRITVQFDIRGRRLQLSDPDAGLIKYDYNALGEVVWSETANQRAASTATTMAYDKLGRMVSRTEPEGSGTWSYDKYADNSSCTMGVGKLCESRYARAGTTDTRATKHYFDSLGREVSDVATVTTNGAASGPTMATARSYDTSTGRLATKTYPTGLKVGYGYTARGQAYQLKLLTQATVNPLPATAGGTPGASTTLAANTVLWQAKVVNAWGRIEEQSYSNGVASRVALEAPTGRITALTAGPGASNTVINQSFSWDSLNNLTYRADNIGDAVAGAVTETFEYNDSLSRLTKYTVAAPAVPTGSRAVTLQYNGLGMLLNKSDVGAYAYGASGNGAVRPHALLTMTPNTAGGGGAAVSYVYDANGNLTSATGGKYRTIAYTSFNLPDSQSGIGGETAASGASSRYTWVYDENRQRVKEVRTITGGTQAGTRTTWYLHPDNAGNLGFEQEVNAPTSPTAANPAGTHNRHYLSFGGRAIGVLISEGTLPAAQNNAPAIITSITLKKVEYWHKDHLGSLIATTDHAGATTARYAYDPFGKRRFTNGSYDPFGTVTVDWSQGTNSGTDRGYTEHEHLDDVGIIHMNGRLFDPMLARFLQTDPFIQDPKNLQNYNRYAYCFNNPLTCTDPTGLEFVGPVLPGWVNSVGTQLAYFDISDQYVPPPETDREPYYQVNDLTGGDRSGDYAFILRFVEAENRLDAAMRGEWLQRGSVGQGHEDYVRETIADLIQTALANTRDAGVLYAGPATGATEKGRIDGVGTKDVGFLDRVADNFNTTNNSIPGMHFLLPTGVGLATTSVTARYINGMTFFDAVAAYIETGQIVRPLTIWSATATLNTLLVGGALQVGNLVGSVINSIPTGSNMTIRDRGSDLLLRVLGGVEP